MTSTIIDVILVLILIACVWTGARRGLVNGIAGLLVMIFAIFGANFVAKNYSREFRPALEPFVNSFVDETISKIQFSGVEDTSRAGDLTAEDENDPAVYTAAVKCLEKIGISSSSAKNLAKKASAGIKSIGKDLKDSLSSEVIKALCYILVFIIAFILIIIVFTIIGTILNLAFRMPGLNAVNYALGGVLGLAKGIIIVCAIACVIQYTGIILKPEVIAKTKVLKYVMNHNLISQLLGI